MHDESTNSVEIYEVGPRDGLQNQPQIVPTATKIALVNALSDVGFTHIEATSFVSQKWVPQLADAGKVMAGIDRHPAITYSALTPNIKGFENALAAGVDEIAIFGAASETFSQKNINASIAESMARFAPVVAAAQSANIPARGYVSCITSCPYEGAIFPEAVRRVVAQLFDLGCYQVSLGDTMGVATAADIARLLDVVVSDFDASQLAGHFHHTNGQAITNVFCSLRYGLRVFDAAIGGLGGCPYAPGAKGNVATELLAAALEEAGWQTGLDMDALAIASKMTAELTK